MNGASRDFAAQAVILLAVCVGAWMMFVQPLMLEAARLETTIENNRGDAPAGSADHVQELAVEASDLRGRIVAIEAAGSLARDSSLLYETMMDRARSHGVYVQSLQPGALQDNQVVSTRKVSMSVQGTYEQIASFIHAVHEMPDFIRPNVMVFVPRVDQSRNATVHGNLSWDFLAFKLPQELASFKGADDVHP